MAATTAKSNLPPELSDRVMACCSDRTSLLQCALVCRAWIPASRSLVFNTRVAVLKEHTNPWREDTRPWQPHWQPVTEIIELLEAPASSLRLHLTDVLLPFSGRRADIPHRQANAKRLLRTFLRMKMRMVGIQWEWNNSLSDGAMPEEIIDLVRASNETLQRVRFIETHGEDTMALLGSIGSCASLQSLSLIRCSILPPPISGISHPDTDAGHPSSVDHVAGNWTDIDQLSPPPALLRIEVLRMQRGHLDVAALVAWIGMWLMQPIRLTFDPVDKEGIAAWMTYISRPHVSSKLTHLSLTYHPGTDVIDCQHMENLTNLEIKLLFSYGLRPNGFRPIEETLKTITAGFQLKSIVLWLWETGFAANVTADFEEMDNLLATKAADDGEVRVVMRGGTDAVEYGKIIATKHLFPRCAEQSRFDFETVDTSSQLSYPEYDGHRPLDSRQHRVPVMRE